VIERLKILQSEKFLSAPELREKLESDSTFRSEIKTLSKHFHIEIYEGCGDCLFDAYIKLFKLKNMEVSKFKVKAGAVLYDPVNKDLSKVLTAANCTDELALYHLKHNPNSKKFFSILPDDADELIENYEEKKENKPQGDKVKQPVVLTEKELAEVEAVKILFLEKKTNKEIAELLKGKGFNVKEIGRIFAAAKEK
jgi:DNA-binding CsgD family transcriptional regulator